MNDESAKITEAWNTFLFDKFVRFRFVLTDGLAGHSDELFRRRPHRQGEAVLDLGSGFGDTTQAIARSVGPKGRAVGVDCAERFVALARRENAAANASFLVGDVGRDPLGGPYDRAFSRFGTMFFPSPVAAMRNVGRALRPGGTLSMIVWRRREDNPWLHEAERRIAAMLGGAPGDSDAITCGPGPFSMASADTVTSILLAAGFEGIVLERFDCDICIGRSLTEAVDFAVALGPAGEALRLAGDEGARREREARGALADVFRPFERADGVWARSSAWFVHATTPQRSFS